jgi:signal transduction histidine kinase
MQIETRELVTVFIAGIVILFLLAGYIIYFLFLYQRKQQKYKEEKRARELMFQEELLRSQLEIKEQTIQHIAHELHDNLGQVASLIKIHLNTLRLDDPDQTRQRIEETKDLVRQLIADVKALSLSMDSTRTVHLGIVTGLEHEIDRVNKTGQFEARLELEGDLPTLDKQTTVILYRMMQEILNNSVKHSGAKLIVLSLKATEKLFTLVCKDDGVGFDLEEKNRSGGLGLLNLKARARLINAELNVHTAPEKGSIVSIELPI